MFQEVFFWGRPASRQEWAGRNGQIPAGRNGQISPTGQVKGSQSRAWCNFISEEVIKGCPHLLAQPWPSRVTSQQVQDQHPDYFCGFLLCFLTQCLRCFVKQVFVEELGQIQSILVQIQRANRDPWQIFLLSAPSSALIVPMPGSSRTQICHNLHQAVPVV